MSASHPPFQKVLDALLDEGKPLPSRYLVEFSDIEPAALASLLEAWPRIAPNRKLLLLDRLDALADEDTLVSFDDLGRALLTDPEAQVRVRAMRLLDECEDHRLIPAYLRILSSDEDVSARAEAASTLGMFVQLGEFEDIPAEAHRQVEDALLEAFNSEDTPAVVRRRALEALGYSSRPEAPVLIEASFKRQNPDWKASALFAMGRSSDERWAEQVLSMLLAENLIVRAAAVKAAGELGLPGARLLLLRLLEEEDDSAVTEAAIWSLSQIGGEDVRIYLESLLDAAEEDDEIAFLEEALDNLAFTEDLAQFDLMAYDADDEDMLEA
ncbi:MAG: HEAT repeat domain-containing protein [Chloroflexota bacterium]